MRALLLLLPLLLCAQNWRIGERVAPIVLANQFGKKEKLEATSCWVVTWDRTTTAMTNDYIAEHNVTCKMIVDVSQVPSGIFSLFVLPRMKHYRHSISLSFDEKYNKAVPYKEGCVTYLGFSKKRLSKIEYLCDERALTAVR